MTRRSRIHVGATLLLTALGGWLSAPVGRVLFAQPSLAAQSPAKGPAPGEIETDPIRCWWKTDKTAIRLGERFTLTLTCGVIETPGITVVPVTTQLEPGAVQLAPFEMVSGVRHDDVVSPPWRYVQYDYTMRLLGEGFAGQDLSIPALPVTYNITAESGGGVQGRDLQYNLPPLPMRALSLVPRAAKDIRDASTESFAALESRRFRASSAFVAAGILFALAGVLVILGGVRALARSRGRGPAVERPLPAAAVLNGCLGALRRVKTDAAQDGWSPALARRALTALRIAGAVALNRPVAQSLAASDVAPREGQLTLRMGLLRPQRSMVSAATTADAIERALGKGNAAPPRRRAMLEPIRNALRVFSTAGYGRQAEADIIALNGALEEGTEAIRRLRVRSMWPMRVVDAVARSFVGF